ncbi:MAG: hypothetical protein R2708_25385 [Vicinamibacterales bacterium]
MTEQLIDWDNIPDDPIYQLTFPQRGMLAEADLERVMDLVAKGATDVSSRWRERFRRASTPHPAGQIEPTCLRSATPLPGMQHKHRETQLFFPSQGQTCHAYCFTASAGRSSSAPDEPEVRQQRGRQPGALPDGPRRGHSALFTGGDPLIM